MIGLATENTEDDGGGKNIGYTHVNDYADYVIFSDGDQKLSSKTLVFGSSL